jgi:hypothetical protein
MAAWVQVIVVEGRLEVAASQQMLVALNHPPGLSPPIDKGGRTKFWADIGKYNNAARWAPIFALADLESGPCASGLIAQHLKTGKHPNLILRVAVRMLESWLLADRKSMASFLRISADLIPLNPDAETHPKQTLVSLARRSKVRAVREDLVPEIGSAGVVGKNYTPRMTEYIRTHWDPLKAQKNSLSLERALAALKRSSAL